MLYLTYEASGPRHMPSAARPEALPVCAPSCHTTAKQPRTTQAARKGAQNQNRKPTDKNEELVRPHDTRSDHNNKANHPNPRSQGHQQTHQDNLSPPHRRTKKQYGTTPNATTHPTNAPHNTPYKISPRLMVKDLLNASNVSASISSEGRPFHNPTLRTPKNLRYNSVRQGGTRRSNLCPRARASGATVTSSRNSPASPSTT